MSKLKGQTQNNNNNDSCLLEHVSEREKNDEKRNENRRTKIEQKRVEPREK